jgi:hypothetical protein
MSANRSAPELIRLDDPADVERWCSIFGCNEAELMQAVHRVGPVADAVNEYLRSTTDRARGVGSGGSGE